MLARCWEGVSIITMRSDFMEFEFGQLHYKYVMSGKKETLLLLHAFQSSAASYAPICELLEDRYNLICLDLPGHGLSARLDCEQYSWFYSMAGFKEILVEFIKRFHLTHYYIVGDSVGGNCAVRAIASLSGLSGLVLMGSAQARTVEMIFSLHHQTEALELLFKKERSQAEDQVVATAYVSPKRHDGECFQLMMHDLQNTDPNCREYFSKQLETQEWMDELQIIQNSTIPLIYILGEDDGFINSPHYRNVLIESGLRDSQIHLLKDVRHVPQLDDPQTTAKLISDFIAENKVTET